MNYPTFLAEVDQIATGFDAVSLRKFVHEIARTLPEESRQSFLDTMHNFGGNSQKTLPDGNARDSVLSDQINHILEALDEIQDGDRELESKVNEQWDDWNDDESNEFLFSDPFGILKDVASAIRLLHEAFDHEEYEKGAGLARRLSELTVQVFGDYEEEMGIRDLLFYDLLDFNLEQTVREALYMACMGNEEPDRAEAMLVIMDNLNCSIPLEAVLQTGGKEIDLNRFLPFWIDALAKRSGEKADRLLTEAQNMLKDKNDILKYAGKYAENHPVLYENLLKKGLDNPSPEEMMRIGIQGMAEVPVENQTRSEMALLTAKYALEVPERQTAEKCWLEAFRSSPTAVNYLRLRLESQCWEKYGKTAQGIYMSYYASRNQYEQKTMALLMFWDGCFGEMMDRFMIPGTGIGWSSTFMKEGIALMLMLLDNGSGNRPGMTSMRGIAVSACSFSSKKYCEGTDVISSPSDSAFFQKCFDKWKSGIVLSEKVYEQWMSKIDRWISLRVSAIMDANRRNYYGECAAFIAALGEVQQSRGTGSKDGLMLRYKTEYSRRHAFHGELRKYGMKI